MTATCRSWWAGRSSTSGSWPTARPSSCSPSSSSVSRTSSGAAQEVAILNRSHPVAKFCLRDDRVVMSYALHAWPFAPAQLRVAVGQLSEGLDDLARDVAARVRGQPVPRPRPRPEGTVRRLVGLLELLYDGPGEAAAGRRAVRQRPAPDHPAAGPAPHRGWTTRASTTSTSCWASCARRCASSPTTGSAPGGRRTRPPRPPRTRQLSLLPEGEDTLDAGAWGHDLEESS